nr:protein YLS9-like [Ipomoea trifida]
MQSNMAEKVYPSKPAFNGATTSPAANSGTNPPKKAQLYHATRPVYRPSSRRNRSCLCSCCLWATFLVIILVFLAAVAGVIFWAVYRPHRPSFTVNSLTFSQFNISSTKLTSNFTSTISARNPNKKLTFLYDPITVSLFSGDVAVGTGHYRYPEKVGWSEPRRKTAAAAWNPVHAFPMQQLRWSGPPRGGGGNHHGNGISGGLGAAIGEVVEDDVELGLALLDLALELPDNPVTTADGINGSHVGFIDNGPHGLVFLRRGEVADDFGNVANTEKLVGVEELALAVVGEIGGEYAIGGALSALVLASGAGLGTVGETGRFQLRLRWGWRKGGWELRDPAQPSWMAFCLFRVF